MVQQASKYRAKLGITREEQDEWAYRSHQRAARQDAGRFDDEIVPVGVVTADEGPPRHDAGEARSAPAGFDPEGTTTAGRARGERRRVLRDRVLRGARSARPRAAATILGQGYVADDYAYLARTPARAGEQALAAAGKAIGDVKRVEINEAFSSVAKNSTRMLGADEAIVNVNGGAVALGHPIGASGGRIVTTMVPSSARGRSRARCHLLGRRARRRAPDRGLKAIAITALAALALAGDAAACVCAAGSMEERLDAADAAVVARLVGSNEGSSSPSRRILTFEVEQR